MESEDIAAMVAEISAVSGKDEAKVQREILVDLVETMMVSLEDAKDGLLLDVGRRIIDGVERRDARTVGVAVTNLIGFVLLRQNVDQMAIEYALDAEFPEEDNA